MKRNITVFLIIIHLMLICSCTSSMSVISPDNYRDKVEIKHLNNMFYSAEYIGKAPSVCFPPITNMICSKLDVTSQATKPVYREVSRLKMDKFEIRISTPGPANQKLIDDMIFLTAADLAVQLGYPFMTRTQETSISACVSTYSARTRGTIYDDNYSARTSIQENVSCNISITGDFIFFENKEDVKNGVFFKVIEGGALYPEEDLYIGTSKLSVPKHYVDKETGYVKLSIINAWRKVYDTSGLSHDLREKYGITDTSPYVYSDRNTRSQRKKSTNPLKKNRVAM